MNPEDKERLKKAVAKLAVEIEILLEKRIDEITEDEEDEEVSKFGSGEGGAEDGDDDD